MSNIEEKNTEEITTENPEEIEDLKEETEEPEANEETTPVEEVKKYNVILDANGYFTGMACFAKYSRFENGVDVEELPPANDGIEAKAYKLENDVWEYSKERHDELLLAEQEKEEAELTPTPAEEIKTLKEQVQLLTDCILEMSTMLY